MVRRFLKLIFHTVMLAVVYLAIFNFRLCIYLCYQGKGQLHLIMNTQSTESFKGSKALTEKQSANLRLISEIKAYAEDSLGFTRTNNYGTIYNQHDKPILWAVTLSDARSLKPYYWRFPLIGNVSYKGFFEKQKAYAEAYHYTAMGYDAEIRPVSAWSTLGWLKDPILSSMLGYSKGALCNLVFHELFHSTYYAPGTVEDNENLATFVGNKATILFLKNDTAALHAYLAGKEDYQVFQQYISGSIKRLNHYYATQPFNNVEKLRLMLEISRGMDSLPFKNPRRFSHEKEEILGSRNAYFVGFNQYHQGQDSLETAFNKIYHGNLLNMVLSLKQKSGK